MTHENQLRILFIAGVASIVVSGLFSGLFSWLLGYRDGAASKNKDKNKEVTTTVTNTELLLILGRLANVEFNIKRLNSRIAPQIDNELMNAIKDFLQSDATKELFKNPVFLIAATEVLKQPEFKWLKDKLQEKNDAAT